MRHRRPSFRLSLSAFALLALWLLPSAVRAHGDLDARIQNLSARIAGQPEDAALRRQRAELYRQHAQFEAALADLTVAARQRPEDAIILLAQARVFSDAGQTTNALGAVQTFLAAQPDHPEALVIRARCQFKLNRAEAAVADYTLALTKCRPPEPDLLLERARAQAVTGHFSAAVTGLDEGMARIGAVPALQLAAIEYERQQARFAAALARVDKLIAGHPVKEPWLVLRAEILAQAARLAEAKTEFQKTIAGLEAYPPARRSLPLTQDLQARANAGLVRVEARLAIAARREPPKHEPRTP